MDIRKKLQDKGHVGSLIERLGQWHITYSAHRGSESRGHHFDSTVVSKNEQTNKLY